MDDLLNKELQEKSQKDIRFTLVLIIGSLFLLVYVVQMANWNKAEKNDTKGYVLNVEDGSFSVVAQNVQGGKVISPIPWHLTPFFFKKMPINSADKAALMTIKGIGPKLAESILHSRAENGLFNESNDLLKIRGVGPKRVLYFEKIFDFQREQ
jgi:competence ComEA-like helix-hairpin-helix protein